MHAVWNPLSEKGGCKPTSLSRKESISGREEKGAKAGRVPDGCKRTLDDSWAWKACIFTESYNQIFTRLSLKIRKNKTNEVHVYSVSSITRERS